MVVREELSKDGPIRRKEGKGGRVQDGRLRREEG